MLRMVWIIISVEQAFPSRCQCSQTPDLSLLLAFLPLREKNWKLLKNIHTTLQQAAFKIQTMSTSLRVWDSCSSLSAKIPAVCHENLNIINRMNGNPTQLSISQELTLFLKLFLAEQGNKNYFTTFYHLVKLVGCNICCISITFIKEVGCFFFSILQIQFLI